MSGDGKQGGAGGPLVGAHMSIAGGLHRAFERLEEAGGNALQIFLKSNVRWEFPDLTGETVRRFEAARAASPARSLVAHACYLVNLAAPDGGVYSRSVADLKREIRHAAGYRIPWLVLHPGNHRGAGVEAGIRKVAAALREVLEETEGCRFTPFSDARGEEEVSRGAPAPGAGEGGASGCGGAVGRRGEEAFGGAPAPGGGDRAGRGGEEERSHAAHASGAGEVARRGGGEEGGPWRGEAVPGILIETTAGQGTALASRLEEVAAIVEGAGSSPRLGVCLDTSHLFAAGYDISTERGYLKTKSELEASSLLGRVRAIHVNDSKAPLGSRVDRHEQIGLGEIGREAFRRIMRDPDWAGVPKILETPKGAYDPDYRGGARGEKGSGGKGQARRRRGGEGSTEPGRGGKGSQERRRAAGQDGRGGGKGPAEPGRGGKGALKSRRSGSGKRAGSGAKRGAAPGGKSRRSWDQVNIELLRRLARE